MNNKIQENNTSKSIDVLILCALKDEYDQVLKVSNGISSTGWHQLTNSDGRIVSDATFTTSDGLPLNIRATFAGYMGREQAQAIASTLIADSKPKCIAMSGICAGNREDLSLGDVIFAERLWSYDIGKSVVTSGIESFKGDNLQYRPDELLVQHMQNLAIPQDTEWLSLRPILPLENQENWVLKCLIENSNPTEHPAFEEFCPDWGVVLKRLWKKGWVEKPLVLSEAGKDYIKELILLNPKKLPEPPQFSIHVAPVATGAVVKVDEDIFSKLSSSMRKVLGLDMEGSGLAASAEAHGIPILFAKGVSDFADSFKDDRYRHFAARASAELLIKLLCEASHLLPGFKPIQSRIEDSSIQIELIKTLAELYSDTEATIAVWERSGGKRYDLELIQNPLDRWQKIWKKMLQGHKISPNDLLTVILDEYPNNAIIRNNLNNI